MADRNEKCDMEPPLKRQKRTAFSQTTDHKTGDDGRKIHKEILSSVPNLIYRREIGNPFVSDTWNFRNIFHHRSWYSRLKCIKRCFTRPKGSIQGSVYNIEFSPDSKFLVAACESLEIVLYDPCIQKKFCRVSNAHKDSVNCITFLDTRTFATCSDDKTIVLWDIRNLQNKVATLKGHTSWVKSITYNLKTKQLISSAFDDTIRTWDINKNYRDGVIQSKKILSVPYLTRTRLSPDFSQMVVATTTGHLFVIHDLNIETVRTDTWEEIRKYVTNQSKGNEVKSTRKNNRVECISDFPSDEKPWCIASLQVHPSGTNILSRYTSANSTSEWSVVHDIQPHTDPEAVANGRLRRYIEEPNLASGFIKELCYNHEGTVICSPFGNSIRLLTFTPDNSQLDTSTYDSKELVEIKSITSHKRSVLTTRFSPTLPIVASGCLGGQVSFYQPRF